MTPSTLLSPLLSYCADLPGFTPDAVEVAETEQRIGTMLSTLHYWEQSAAEWRASAEQFRRDAALESAKRIRDCDNFASALDVQAHLLADANAQLEAMHKDREQYKGMAECAAIMAVCGYFSRMRGPDAWQFMTAGKFPSDEICLIEPTRSRGLYRELYAGSAPVPAEAKVADGWVLVPREPTEEMVIAALKEVDPLRELIDWTDGYGFMREDARRAWSAMLAAKAKEN